MLHGRRWMAGVLVLFALLPAACAKVAEEEEALNEPVTLEPIEGTDVSLITLTQEAADRLDIEADTTQTVGSETAIPYAAVFYTSEGDTWAYTSPESLTFVRVPIVVDHVRGDRAFLTEGPPAGMEVVTQGLAELYGTETDVEE